MCERKTRKPACATTACCGYEDAAPASAARRDAGAVRVSAPPWYTAAEDHPQCLGIDPPGGGSYIHTPYKDLSKKGEFVLLSGDEPAHLPSEAKNIAIVL